MAKYIGVGSNLGSRLENITKAIKELQKVCEVKNISPLYETTALLPDKAPDSWNLNYLNGVIQIEYSGMPREFLVHLKVIEEKLGRLNSKKWSPRSIDLDILVWDGEKLEHPDLSLPHPEIYNRSFVLDPLKDLSGAYLAQAREHKSHSPLWMAILNLTPDSFSDGGTHGGVEQFIDRVHAYYEMGVQIMDIGAESTRPGARVLSDTEEWDRLAPYLQSLRERYCYEPLRPLISVDTHKAAIAENSIELGVDIINDVSGLSDPNMLSVIKNSEASYVLMHSLSVPADPKKILNGDPIKELCLWLESKAEVLYKHNISAERVFFDPGLGFGKNSNQSVEIIKNIEAFKKYPFKILVGHSRKSFLKNISPKNAGERDAETLGASMQLINSGVEVLRVHNPELHIRAHRGWKHVAG